MCSRQKYNFQPCEHKQLVKRPRTATSWQTTKLKLVLETHCNWLFVQEPLWPPETFPRPSSTRTTTPSWPATHTPRPAGFTARLTLRPVSSLMISLQAFLLISTLVSSELPPPSFNLIWPTGFAPPGGSCIFTRPVAIRRAGNRNIFLSSISSGQLCPQWSWCPWWGWISVIMSPTPLTPLS